MFHSRPARKVRAYRPRLEILEDRTLLSTYLVDHLADDMVGSGLNGSLRYCITNAVDGDAITFGEGVTGTIQLTGALPLLTHSINIEGPGPNLLTVSGQGPGSYSVFWVEGTVAISGLTITNGGGGVFGGGIENYHGSLTLNNCTVSNNSAFNGGGIDNNAEGTALVNNCTIANNTVEGGGDITGGGGIANHNHGTMTIVNSTISGNTAHAQRVYPAYGGGIWNNNGGHLLVTNSTITGNVAYGDPLQGDGDGGGIFSSSGTLTINNSTISGNSADYMGGGILIELGTRNMRNSIVAGNTAGISAPDLDGALTSSGYNLIGNTQGGSGFAATDLLNVNPLLGPLQNNGGPTQTMALLAGSPALNAGDPAQLGVADQRGVIRSGGVNIGAYQASASAFVLSAPDTVQAGEPFDVTVTAVDMFGQTALGYTGTVTFSTTDPDPGVMLPADYTFTLGDQGTHTFGGGFALMTPGTWSITATDAAGGFSGSTVVTVNGGADVPGRHGVLDGVDAVFAMLFMNRRERRGLL
jgi:hypothetical protein